MTELIIEKKMSIGKIPDFNDHKYGKIQVSSTDLAPYVGKKLNVKMIVTVD